MKLLINICSHDGIISHYNGVGTMTKRYISTITKYLNTNNIEYKMNLITPRYNTDSFGYSESTYKIHCNLKNTEIIQIENGSQGKVNYGTIVNWNSLTNNTAKFINKLNFEDYDRVITIYNDTPFALLASKLTYHKNHISIWIPHSTIKIHQVDSAVLNTEKSYNERLKWEEESINYINSHENCFVGVIGNFIKEHLIKEYKLNLNKAINIFNGEILDTKKDISNSDINKKLFSKIMDYDALIISFSRAEKYKNLEATMCLGNALNMKTVVIAQSYFKEQEILNDYKKSALLYDSDLFIDPPFDFPWYILNHFNKPIIVLVPSKKEIMGLIINEVRKLNKNNILIVSNDIDGLNEQITDGYDGILVDLDSIEESKEKIKKYFNLGSMKEINENGFKTLTNKYDFYKNIQKLMNELIDGEKYE